MERIKYPIIFPSNAFREDAKRLAVKLGYKHRSDMVGSLLLKLESGEISLPKPMPKIPRIAERKRGHTLGLCPKSYEAIKSMVEKTGLHASTIINALIWAKMEESK